MPDDLPFRCPAGTGAPADREMLRRRLQDACDAARSPADRNRLGQVATPFPLARDIVDETLRLNGGRRWRHLLDPAVGTGAFISALAEVAGAEAVARSSGFEIDPHYGDPAEALWQPLGFDLRRLDFTRAEPDRPADLLICNPPYVRHHHLDVATKSRLRAEAEAATGVRPGGLAGLYVYFLLLAHRWLAPGAVAAWLIPGEFMDVGYGLAAKRYLTERVSLDRIHRFDPRDGQFDGALVSSCVVWLRNLPPAPDHEIAWTEGGTISSPLRRVGLPGTALAATAKWTGVVGSSLRPVRQPDTSVPARPGDGIRGGGGPTVIAGTVPVLGDLFTIRRGIATGSNRFFVLSEARRAALGLPREAFLPVLPGARHLPVDRIAADADGLPCGIAPLWLLDCRLPPAEIAVRWPALAHYLESGAETVATGYLCRHRRPWYAQEERPAAPFLCTYMGRRRGGTASDPGHGDRAFRFILNESRARATNVYLLLHPRPAVAAALVEDPARAVAVWRALNALAPDSLVAAGRVYGGGLHKLEPRELAQVPARSIADLLASRREPFGATVFPPRA